MNLSSINVPILQDPTGFSVAIYVPAVKEDKNNLLSSKLDVNFSVAISEAYTNGLLLSVISTAAILSTF